MKQGFLSQYFEAVAAKTLSAVEADFARSNQHEFNGSAPLRKLFGTVTGTATYPAKFLYLSDTEEEPVVDEGEHCFISWYDARARSAERTGRSEYRLYFPRTRASDCAAEGDLLFLGKLDSGLFLVLVAEGGSTIASQLQWLFGTADLTHPGFALREELDTENDRIGFVERIVLEQIGVEVVDLQAENYLDQMLARFGRAFPPTRLFSEYARSTLGKVRPADDPDRTLMDWMEREELLFRALERELVRERLVEGFDGDVDSFLKFSLSVQNRRKSRAGAALENHLCKIFEDCQIRYTQKDPTENNSKPDFLFPGITEYRSASFPGEMLTMLGAKTTCKDRWRQVLAEAAQISRKHLLTLEAAISAPQTDEMNSHGLQLVVPQPLHATYSDNQRRWLMDLRSFIGMVRVRQI